MHFIIITDYLALKALKDKLILIGRLLRRVEKLIEYDFNIVYWASSKNIILNFLSRIYVLFSLSNKDSVQEEMLITKKKIRSIYLIVIELS